MEAGTAGRAEMRLTGADDPTGVKMRSPDADNPAIDDRETDEPKN